MSNRALELYEKSRPLESLESFIFRTAQRASRGHGQVLALRSVHNNQGRLEFGYDVKDREPLGPQQVGALGGLAVATVLTVKALVTRKPGHVLSAIQAGSVALAIGGHELPRLWSRWKGGQIPTTAVLGLRGGQLSFKVGAEEILVDLAPIVGLTVRSFRFHWEPNRPALHFAHFEMQDGRLLTLTETEDSVAVRRLVHHLAKPAPVELSFQNIDLYREGNRVSWELGPRLVEPALN